MTKKIYLSLLLFIPATLCTKAQVVEDDEDGVEIITENDANKANGDIETLGTSTSSSGVIMEDGTEQPMGMTANVDSLLQLWHSKQYLDQNAESGSYYPSEPILADSATYVLRLRRLPTTIDMPYNDIVKNHIEQYAGKRRRSVSYWLGAQNFYTPIFEEALEAYNIPLELKYLPIIESGLDPNAVSRAGATGLWQFMMSPTKAYDLEVTTLTDDRRDPVKSSWAAAHMLHDLYNIYKDWQLAIAAYNCGPSNVNKAIHRANESHDFWEVYPYLPKETRGYVPSFVAITYIMNYYCEHGIRPMAATLPLATDTIIVNAEVDLNQVAKLCDLSLEEVRALNPQYRKDIVPGLWRPCAIRLPQDAVTKFIKAGDAIYERTDDTAARRSAIDMKDPEEAMDASYSRDGRTLSSGRGQAQDDNRSRYSAHDKSKAKSKSKSKSKSRSKYKSQTVTIKKGETLSTIAKRNGTTVEKLQKLNGLKGSLIREGKKLKVK